MRATLYIQNLKCGGCEATIYNKLSTLHNINEMFVNVDESSITIDYNSDEDLEVVKEKLSAIGYPILGDENRLMTKAKSYVSCAIGRITR